MVASFIGLLTTLFITQAFVFSDAQLHTVTASDDGLTNGVIALYTLEKEIQGSGLGISSLNLLGCELNLGNGIMLSGLAPVTINHAAIPAGDANTDTLLIVTSADFGAPEGAIIQNQPSLTIYEVNSPTAFHCGDRVIATVRSRPEACSLLLDRVTKTPGTDGSCPVSADDPDHIVVNTGALGVSPFGTLYNLGTAPSVKAYAIRSGQLTLCDYMVKNCGNAKLTSDPTVWIPVASGIVSLRAQYGRDDTETPVDGIVDTYNQTLPAIDPVQCVWARIIGLRIAVVSRSNHYEKTVGSGKSAVNVTQGAPVWAGTSADNPPGSAAYPIDLSMNPDGSANASWKNYRYRIFETVIPLRNVLMMDATGC